MRDTTYFDTIILGAGASGLMCAARASQRGKKVLLLDHASILGRKLAVTGGGKGNITNLSLQHTDYVGQNPKFTRSALARFSPKDLLTLVEDFAIPIEEREHHQIFCKRSAQDIIAMLERLCSSCCFSLCSEILGISYKKTENAQVFEVKTTKATYSCPSLVVATGSPAWPQVGATDFGIHIAKQFGHNVIPWQPALVGLTMPHQWLFSGLEGISIQATIFLHSHSENKSPTKKVNKKQEVATNLPLLFTHKGISGPATLQASLYYMTGDIIEINLLPEVHIEEVLDNQENRKKIIKTVITSLLPARIAERVIPEHIAERKVAEVSAKDRASLANNIHTCFLSPTGNEGMKKAEVAKGGVSTKDISSKTLESKRTPGLYFCGEVLDITGRLGGYNLHWAFASGFTVGDTV